MRQLRIVFVIENLSFPRDPRVRQEALTLSQQGCRVSVVCPAGKALDSTRFEVIDEIRVYRYWQPWSARGVFGYFLEYGWAMACSFALLTWIWIREGFDVVHAANPPDLLCLVAFPFILIGKKFVYDQHDLCPELLSFRFSTATVLRKLCFLMEWLSYKLATLVIVTNQSAYDIALARGARTGRLYIVRNGPDLEVLVETTAKPSPKNGGQYLAVYAGTIGPQDGVDRLIMAAHYIIHQRGRSDVRFALLGDGDCLEQLRNMARELKIESFIDFCGWVSSSTLETYLLTADLCLSPEPASEYNQRSSFIKLTEYMCYGKVTVCSDLLESRRTLGDAGLFVDTDDPALFGNAILEILNAPERCDDIGRLAVERFRTSFHWGLSRKVLIEAYENAFCAVPLSSSMLPATVHRNQNSATH